VSINPEICSLHIYARCCGESDCQLDAARQIGRLRRRTG
jgi:hypothetical protein